MSVNSYYLDPHTMHNPVDVTAVEQSCMVDEHYIMTRFFTLSNFMFSQIAAADGAFADHHLRMTIYRIRLVLQRVGYFTREA